MFSSLESVPSEPKESTFQPLLNDLYHINLAYSYWKNGRGEEEGTFDIFYRIIRPSGEFAIFAGLEDCLQYLKLCSFSQSDIEYLQTIWDDSIDPLFFHYLLNSTMNNIKVYSVPEGTVIFPRVPVLRLEGPLPMVELIKTNLLRIVDHASLVATNAARYKLAAGSNVFLYELGQRRGQGQDGALATSKYAYIGGFHGTSNALAGKLHKIPLISSQGRSYITAFTTLSDCKLTNLKRENSEETVNILDLSMKWRKELSEFLGILEEEANDGEFAAFISLAIALPKIFLALIDSYDIRGGLLNFCSVALALNEVGYTACGVQISKGDLSWSSQLSRETFQKIFQKYQLKDFKNLQIFARTVMSEDSLLSLTAQGHSINAFGIDTHVFTCPKQIGLKWYCELVQVNDQPCGKGCTDVDDATIPGKKSIFRLYGKNGLAVIDLLQGESEPIPVANERVLCCHPFQESKRAYVQPTKVTKLSRLYWKGGVRTKDPVALVDVKLNVKENLDTLESSIKRNLNPVPHKVSVSETLFKFMHKLLLQNTPVRELK